MSFPQPLQIPRAELEITNPISCSYKAMSFIFVPVVDKKTPAVGKKLQ